MSERLELMTDEQIAAGDYSETYVRALVHELRRERERFDAQALSARVEKAAHRREVGALRAQLDAMESGARLMDGIIAARDSDLAIIFDVLSDCLSVWDGDAMPSERRIREAMKLAQGRS